MYPPGKSLDSLSNSPELELKEKYADELYHETVRKFGRFGTITYVVLERPELGFVICNSIAISSGTSKETFDIANGITFCQHLGWIEM